MSIHDLRDYYKNMESKAVMLMMAQPEGPNKQSAEEAVEYYRTHFFHYNALCLGVKP